MLGRAVRSEGSPQALPAVRSLPFMISSHRAPYSTPACLLLACCCLGPSNTLAGTCMGPGSCHAVRFKPMLTHTWPGPTVAGELEVLNVHVPRNRIGDSYFLKLQEGAQQKYYQLLFQERQENIYTGEWPWPVLVGSMHSVLRIHLVCGFPSAGHGRHLMRATPIWELPSGWGLQGCYGGRALPLPCCAPGACPDSLPLVCTPCNAMWN